MLTLFVIILWPIRSLRFEVRGYFIMGMASVLLLAMLVFLLYLQKGARRRHQDSGPPPLLSAPAGPRGWPLLGFWSRLGTQPYRTLGALADSYGPICSVFLGQQKALVINNRAILDEILIEKAAIFSGFPMSSALPIAGHALSIGRGWRSDRQIPEEEVSEVHRTFVRGATSELKSAILESLVKSELESMCEVIHGHREEQTDFRELLPRCWAAVLERIVLGSRRNPDPTFAAILDLLSQRNDITTSMGPYLALTSWLKRLPLLANASNYRRLMELESEFQAKCFQLTSTYEVDLEAEDRSFLDMYLAEQRSRQAANPDDHCFNVEHLTTDIVVLLEHVHEAPWASSLWALQLVSRYPDVQDKIYAELSALYGDASATTPRWSDRRRLPYTWSAVAEIRRTAPALPLANLPRNVESTLLSGFSIPANSCLLANTWRINCDPAFWGDPHNFRPERFRPVVQEESSSSTTKSVRSINTEHVLPYFLGPKTWVDNDVILMPVFLTLTTLLLRFRFLSPEDNLICEDGFTLKPVHGQLRAIPR